MTDEDVSNGKYVNQEKNNDEVGGTSREDTEIEDRYQEYDKLTPQIIYELLYCYNIL